MAQFKVDTDKLANVSHDIVNVSARLKAASGELALVKLAGSLTSSAGRSVEQTLRRIVRDVSDEAAKMSSFSKALQTIADKYRETEKAISGMKGEESASSQTGTDKRSGWRKFWDWVFNKEPDEYDTTTKEQEKAADAAMKQELWTVLQNEKYSEENWSKASVEQRKQILQDYMDEVIKIYGLQDVKHTIDWSPNSTYTPSSITWGYYSPDYHTVSLNVRALSDSVGSWNSYDLFGTVAHELRHAYQHEAVDHPTRFMVSKETIDTWGNNFKPGNYISSEDDYDAYRAQPVEVDARNFEVSRNQRQGNWHSSNIFGGLL